MRVGALGIAAFARAIGILAVLAALVAAAIHLRSEPLITVRVDTDPFARRQDPLEKEVARCRGLGMAALDDPSCEAAWSENRRRFFGDAASASSPVRPTV
ncbi:MAG: putative entry exclusion protein TrbK-alt, partial [Hyphomicrobiales bacterium]|nr:putative entry exclusion protein TrbK-alt [Hyphomicrobiales bacterium]